jgi:hypothetical protein
LPTSPKSPPISGEPDDVFGFEGADIIRQAWRDGLTPDPPLTVSQWADRHRYLSPRGSAEPGRYRTDRTPYMRDIMDALSPVHPARRVVFMKAAQVDATESGNCWLGYIIHHAPGPVLAVQPTVELAKRFSRQRIDPLIADSPVLKERVKPARSRDAGNTVLSKEFPAGLLVITGANSAVGLRPSRSARQTSVSRPLAGGAGALPVSRRGGRLSAIGGRGRRSGGAGRSPHPDFFLALEGVSGLDTHHPRVVADRARIRGFRPAAFLRAVPALRYSAMAAF